MNVGDLRDALAEFGDDVPVIVLIPGSIRAIRRRKTWRHVG